METEICAKHKYQVIVQMINIEYQQSECPRKLELISETKILLKHAIYRAIQGIIKISNIYFKSSLLSFRPKPISLVAK